MASSTVKLPKMGDTADEVVVMNWLVDVGSAVRAGDPLLVVETGKVEVEVPSPVAGVVTSRLVEAEDEIATGCALCVIET